MTDKEAFINLFNELIKSNETNEDNEDYQKAVRYFNEVIVKDKPSKVSVEITENGTKILSWMQDNWKDYSNAFSAKTIGEGIFESSRSVSGAMRKLVSAGFVEKNGSNPCSYSITEKGKTKELIIDRD